MNYVQGRGPHFTERSDKFNHSGYTNVDGLDRLAWGNVRPDKNDRYWAHLILAVIVVVYACFVFFDELRGYIRLRQAYLTSPQHRLRASATTVLVTAIPRKWCTFEALSGLYDVFPGGIRNIWINRNYDELSEKVKERNKIATKLEAAETTLIQNAKKAHLKKLEEDAKRLKNQSSKQAKLQQTKVADENGAAMAATEGISSGNPHQVLHTIDEAFATSTSPPSRNQSPERTKPLFPIPVLEQGMGMVGHGIDNFGRTVFRGLKQAGKDVDDRLNTNGFVADTSRQTDGTNDEEGGNQISPENGQIAAGGPEENHVEASPYDGPGSNGRQDNSYAEDRSAEPDILRNPQRLGEAKKPKGSGLKFWRHERSAPYGIPSPIPHGKEEDEFPLASSSPVTPRSHAQGTINDLELDKETAVDDLDKRKIHIPHLSKDKTQKREYPMAYDEDYYSKDDTEQAWKIYVKEKDRETMRLPVWNWMPSLPLIGQKVDTIEYCRRELARLNVEIEQDQREPEKFPLMNSAFVQFNHQVAAHMACQAVSHHTPNNMAPRAVEISPDDVIWDNMSIRWWESYIRTGIVIILIIGLIIGWAFPVTFTGFLSQVQYLSSTYHWLRWLGRAPTWVLSIVQGLLPQLLLAGLLALLPIILRILARSQGVHTGMAVELTVQTYYFAFLFVQVFLVVSISSGITSFITKITEGPQNVPSILASDLPKASNYFFSYMLLQAFSVSAGALVQVMSLISWFILAPLLDNTARQKWRRQTSLPDMQWGTFFPVYTNLAAIGRTRLGIPTKKAIKKGAIKQADSIAGLIYSVISPLIMVFNIITFSLFWLVYRYNTLYVTKFRFDTGGLLYPKAINQLFTGLYTMELCLIGLFFLVRNADENGNPTGTPCKGQAVTMIIVLICTAIYQILLNDAFAPLFRYLPITLEDEAVMRDEEFARAQEKRWNLDQTERDGDDINDVLADRARRSVEESKQAEELEMRQIRAWKNRGRLDPRSLGTIVPSAISHLIPARGSWADRSRNWGAHEAAKVDRGEHGDPTHFRRHHRRLHHHDGANSGSGDPESQRAGTGGTNPIGDALFSGINDEIEDLTPEERDKLVQRAFQHAALRSRRPVVWIPRDDLGVSDDEIRRTHAFSEHIWISNEYTGLDAKARVVYRRSPPDFSEVDLIEL